MDRKTTVKTMRDIIRKLQDESLFYDSDFEDVILDSDLYANSRVKEYLLKKLDL